MDKIPSQVVDFRAYNGNNRLFGNGAEVTLPTITSRTTEVDLPSGTMGTENLELEVPFVLFDREAASVVSLTRVTTIVLRGSAQRVNTDSHDFMYEGLKVTAKGFAKEIELGTLKRSDKMDSKITLTLSYIKVEDSNGNVFLEIDKLNGTFRINGEDVRAGIAQYL